MPRYHTRMKPKSRPERSLLPLWLVLTGLALVMIAGWAFLSGSAQSQANIQVKGAPRLSVGKDTIDHGNVKLGNPVRDDIRVTNVGDQPLQFTEAPYIEVKEGC